MMSLGLAMIAASMMTAGVADATPPTTILQKAMPDTPTKSAEKRYCVRTTITGSRMPQKVCRTRKAWLVEGFDPLAPAG